MSDHLDGLVLEGMEDEVVASWVRALRALGGWTVVDLQEVRPSAVVWGLYERWSLAVAIPQSTCLERQASSWDELLAPMSARARKAMRRSMRSAERAGVAAHPVTGADVGPAVVDLLADHREQWAERTASITEEHLTDRFETFLREAVIGMVQREQAALFEFRDADGTVARVLFLVGADYVGYYLYSATPRALEEFHVTALLMHVGVDLACSRHVPMFSFLRGDEAYKRRWVPEAQVSHRLVLGRARPSWMATAGVLRLRAETAGYVRSEASPPWLEDAFDRLRGRS